MISRHMPELCGGVREELRGNLCPHSEGLEDVIYLEA
jgi:hypothetical protein